MKLKQILTHPGGAHKDDLLACSVLLAENPAPILRRDPTGADLADPAIAVVDCGGEHAPERSNFDHHQFPRDHSPTCALSLVLDHLGLYDDARRFCDWLETSEWLDCRGPVGTAGWLGVDRDILGKLNSPVDITLLRRFAAETELLPGHPVWEVMRMIGIDLVDYVKTLRARLDFIAQTAVSWELESGALKFKALFMPRTDPLPEEPSAGLGRFVEEQGLEREMLALVYPDRRSKGYGLRRFNDDPRLDFCRIADEPDVHFAHTGGFIAKTESSDPERLKELLLGACVPE